MFDRILHWGGWPCCPFFFRSLCFLLASVGASPLAHQRWSSDICQCVIRPLVRSFGKILMQIHSVWHADIRTIIWLLSVVSLFSSLCSLRWTVRFRASGGMATLLPCFMMAMCTAIPGGRVLHHWTAVATSPRKITTLHGNDHTSLTTFESMLFFFQKSEHVCSQEGNFCLGNFG